MFLSHEPFYAAREDCPSFSEQSQMVERNLLSRAVVTVLAYFAGSRKGALAMVLPAQPNLLLQTDGKLLGVAML